MNVPDVLTKAPAAEVTTKPSGVYAHWTFGDEEFVMTTETTPSRVNVMEYSGKQFLLDLDRKERAEFYKLLDEAPWEGPTASGHWQVRDLCGHMIDVTESYLERFALARAGEEAPAPLGLPIMAT